MSHDNVQTDPPLRNSISAHIPALSVAFLTHSYSVREDAGLVEVCVVIVGGGVDTEKSANVEFDLSLIANTAQSGK